MYTSVIALGLAALSVAAPVTETKDLKAIYLNATGYPVLTLNAVDSGTIGVKKLVFERPAAFPGSPAYLNGTLINFDLGDSQPYAFDFPEVGDNYGEAVQATANFGAANGRSGFSISPDGTVNAELHAALEHFFACNTTTPDGPILGLFWGVPQNTESGLLPPNGCVYADIIAQPYPGTTA